MLVFEWDIFSNNNDNNNDNSLNGLIIFLFSRVSVGGELASSYVVLFFV